MCAQTHRWGLGTIQTCKSGLKVAVLHEMRAGTIINLSFWCKSLWFDAQNDRLHLWLRYFLLQSKTCKSGPKETCNFSSKVAVFNAQNNRWGLEPIETSNSVPKVAVLHSKITGGVLYPQRLVILVLKSLFWMHKTTGEGWNSYSLFILELSTLLCVLKPTDEVWDPYRLVSLVLKSLFCMRWGMEPL